MLNVYNYEEPLLAGCWRDENGEICYPLTPAQNASMFALVIVALGVDATIIAFACNGSLPCIFIASIMISLWIMSVLGLCVFAVKEFIKPAKRSRHDTD